MQDKIIAAIAAYLGNQRWSWRLPLGNYETSAEIAAAIAPLVEPKDYPYNELFDHMSNEHGLTLTNTELGDIINIARGK